MNKVSSFSWGESRSSCQLSSLQTLNHMLTYTHTHTHRYMWACTPTQWSWGAQVQALKLKAIEAFPFVRPFVPFFLFMPPLLPTRFILSPHLFLSAQVPLSAALLSSLFQEWKRSRCGWKQTTDSNILPLSSFSHSLHFFKHCVRTNIFIQGNKKPNWLSPFDNW